MSDRSMTAPGGPVPTEPNDDQPQPIDGVTRVRQLHAVTTMMTMRPGCGEDGHCDHEDECPVDNPVQVCRGCRDQLETAYYYVFERAGAVEQVEWPCETIQALDGVSA